MLMPPGVKVFMAAEPVDLRASFFRLATHVRATLDADRQSGPLYLFGGKGRDLVKILFWTATSTLRRPTTRLANRSRRRPRPTRRRVGRWRVCPVGVDPTGPPSHRHRW